MKLSDNAYNVLKWIAQYLLPALATLYFGLSSVWGFPHSNEIVGTISAVDTFLGMILGVSTKYYEGDGTLHIDKSGDSKDVYRMSLNTPLEEVDNKKSVTFKIDSLK